MNINSKTLKRALNHHPVTVYNLYCQLQAQGAETDLQTLQGTLALNDLPQNI